jgi:selenophosphate synthetase-related protein
LNPNREEESHTIAELSNALKEFKGITRKSVLGELFPILGEKLYDDAGVLEIGDFKVVVSADGIVEDLVREDPWLAGFYSVVVNVNDVVAKGARPLGYAHVLASNSSSMRRQIVSGIRQGIQKYGLQFLKGHTHPDTSYDAIDAIVVGVAHNVLSSATAKPEDSLIIALDLDGKSGSKSWVKTFDSVMFKNSEQVLNRLEAIVNVAEKKLAHACRDISGPGIVGTITMLCESSHVGASIQIDSIPKPEDLDILDWLMTYPSIGFVLATDTPQKCLSLLRKHGLTADVAGKITKTKTIQISYQGQDETFMNLEKESIFGLGKKTFNEAKAHKIDVRELSESDAAEIEELFKNVWSKAYEYPEEWRQRRILTKKQILNEMKKGYRYFGIRIGNRLVGVYKALITGNDLFGEHQTVDPEFRGFGLATAMYHQFIKFAAENNCNKIYVNILVNQAASIKAVEKMGFHKKGQEYEQAKGMKVQMYELEI